MKKEVNHTPLHVASYPIGVDSRTKPIKSLLQNGHIDEVHMVGIYGVGGIGKTTLAKDIYNRLFRDVHFDGSCFLSDVRLLEKKGLERVQEKLLNILFKTEEYKVRTVAEGINLIKRKLGSKKSFSTSRLCWGGERHNQIFSGLPLALVTLGSHLRWESIENWRRKFKRLKEIPRDDIQKTLKKTKILNACGFHTECEIATLVQKQLLQGVLGGCGSGNVQVMRLDEPGELEGVELSTDAFKKMKKLRVLIINGLRIHGDLWHFPKELKWLSWQRCHLKYIPPNFPAANLVVLNMEGSAIEEFGLNFQCCPRLKELNLSWCSALKKTPNFNGATNLETLKLQGFSRLKEIVQSICQLKSLKFLDIARCFSVRTLPIDKTSDTDIKQLPTSAEMLRNLETLENPFNKDFFSAHALIVKRTLQHGLQINLESNEIPGWCSYKVTAPSVCFTMPTVHNKDKYKFFGMVVWLVNCHIKGLCSYGHFVVTVSYRENDVKQLAEGVRGSISNVIGTHIFVQIYSHIRKNIKSKRDKRKQEEKVIAVVNPMRNAKRKLRIAEKHKAHKKRKMMSMKMDVVECVLL
ncbi:uncharacterized protein [Solanum tuberosum]|uniref:uncharacterized protein n=1 Tax=Solanum tuberosum TaxID=4113 RepID=UPI00073A24FC|nr:PREDICTED: uncharacterized protein LOC102588964 [Solanum tuberosum]